MQLRCTVWPDVSAAQTAASALRLEGFAIRLDNTLKSTPFGTRPTESFIITFCVKSRLSLSAKENLYEYEADLGATGAFVFDPASRERSGDSKFQPRYHAAAVG